LVKTFWSIKRQIWNSLRLEKKPIGSAWQSQAAQAEGLGITLSKTPKGFWMHSFGLPGFARNPKHSFGLQAAKLPVEPKNPWTKKPLDQKTPGPKNPCLSKKKPRFFLEGVQKNQRFNPLQNPLGFGVTFGLGNRQKNP